MTLPRLLIALLLCLSLLLPSATASAQSPTYLPPETGFAVVDSPQGNFLSEFRRLGGLDTLGLPVSQPFAVDGFTYQAFQRAVLQWHPEINQAVLANVMDWLSDAGKDPYLASLGIPLPLPDSGGSWQQVVAERESWLAEPHISAAYRQGGGYNQYGLPTSRPERAGPFIVQRFQRYAFQLWVDDVPGMPRPGSVVGVLAGDLLRQAGLVFAAPRAPAAGPAAATPAVGGCVSNPQSAVKSADVDVVRYRFTALASGGTGLELTLRNNCDEPRRIFFSGRLSRVQGGPPVVAGGEQAADFGPFEEKQFVYDWRTADSGAPQTINPAWSVSFRWNWYRQGAGGQPVCLDVGSDRCLMVDPRLRSTVEALSADPAAVDLLRAAADNKVTVGWGDLPQSVMGTYFRPGHTITLSTLLDGQTEFERGFVLVHELRHAADQFSGIVVDSAQSCLASEERAFRASAEVWANLWGGHLPEPDPSTLCWRLNEVAREASARNGELKQAVFAMYEGTCQ